MSVEYGIELPLHLKEIIDRKPKFLGEKNRNSLIDLIIRHLRNITKKDNIDIFTGITTLQFFKIEKNNKKRWIV